MVQENCLKNKIIVICGPTASGKTSLAVELAKSLKTEIISADSMNIYKGLDIGTAKPTLTERREIKHHLIDVVDPKESFSVGDYKEIAEPIVKSLIENGKIPIICGGTGFYINSLLYDFSYGNHGADLVVRERYYNLAKENGNKAVYDILVENDPETAEKLHPNDLKRVIRALEIFENGYKKSQLTDEQVSKYDFRAYFIDFDRNVLYERINRRVDEMFEKGLLVEVKNLIDNGLTLENQSMQGIGYKELLSYYNGEISIEQAKDDIKRNTRRYAKRQITFFKKMENICYLAPNDTYILAKEILKNYD